MLRSNQKEMIKTVLRRGTKLILIILVVLIILSIVQVLLLRYIDPPYTFRTAAHWLQNKIASKPYEKPFYYWRRLNEISPHLKKAVLASEDQRFLSHHGFDFVELNIAIRDVLAERRIRGASTITMQVARTVFLWHGKRSMIRKIVEAYYTVLIELFWTKPRILEMYLNTVDWGVEIMGAEAASKTYFNTSADRLDPSQAARLAAILPRPHAWSPKNPNAQVKQRQKRIRKDMKKMPLL